MFLYWTLTILSLVAPHQLSWRSFYEIEFRCFLDMLNKMIRLPEMPTFNYWVVYFSISFFFISKSPWLWFRWSHLLKIAAPCNFRPVHFAFSITSAPSLGKELDVCEEIICRAASFVTSRCEDIPCIKYI